MIRLLLIAVTLIGLCSCTRAQVSRPDTVTVAVDNLRADFADLYHGLQSAHVDLFAHRSRADYDARFDEMLAALDKDMSAFDAQVYFQKFVAYGNVAHARIEFPQHAFRVFREGGGKTLPIYLRIADGQAYVGENYSGNPSVAIGQKILALNGVAMRDWLQLAAEHVSADTPYIAHSLLEFTFPQYVWLELGEVATFELELMGADGRRHTQRVSAATRDLQRAQAQSQPKTFSLSSNERVARMLDEGTAYLRPGPFYNVENPAAVWDNTAFVAFIDDAFESFIDAKASSLIMDLRQNPGGDNSFSDPMLAWIADEPFRFCSAFLIRSSDEAAASNQRRLDANAGAVESVSARFAKEYARVPRGQNFEFDIPLAQPRAGAGFNGDVYVLVDRHAYSNAVNVAAIIQDYGFGIVAGEKTSDMATTYGAMETFSLPRTKMDVGFPKAHIIRPSGDRVSDGVTPDWPISSPIAPTPNDIVLQALVNRIAAATD